VATFWGFSGLRGVSEDFPDWIISVTGFFEFFCYNINKNQIEFHGRYGQKPPSVII